MLFPFIFFFFLMYEIALGHKVGDMVLNCGLRLWSIIVEWIHHTASGATFVWALKSKSIFFVFFFLSVRFSLDRLIVFFSRSCCLVDTYNLCRFPKFSVSELASTALPCLITAGSELNQFLSHGQYFSIKILRGGSVKTYSRWSSFDDSGPHAVQIETISQYAIDVYTVRDLWLRKLKRHIHNSGRFSVLSFFFINWYEWMVWSRCVRCGLAVFFCVCEGV